MRRRAKVDANQAVVVSDLRQMGFHVEPKLARVGQGVPDLLVSWRGRWGVVELKDPDQPPSKRRLTKDEKKWHEEAKAPVIVATCADDVLEWFMK